VTSSEVFILEYFNIESSQSPHQDVLIFNVPSRSISFDIPVNWGGFVAFSFPYFLPVLISCYFFPLSLNQADFWYLTSFHRLCTNQHTPDLYFIYTSSEHTVCFRSYNLYAAKSIQTQFPRPWPLYHLSRFQPHQLLFRSLIHGVPRDYSVRPPDHVVHLLDFLER
jgi:hypothetical protein